MTRSPLVVAIGGNALVRPGEGADVATQRTNIARAVRGLAAVAERYRLVIVHGNGPQVGLLALQAAAFDGVEPYPLDVLGAESEGMIGYLLELELRNALSGREVATLLTQVTVDPDDAAFSRPTKPIGPTYMPEDADVAERDRGWAMTRAGAGLRRVVASPDPRSVVELAVIRQLVALDVVVVCLGGGGVPVIADGDGTLGGVEAVVDKDLAAALLAVELDAHALVLLTDVQAVSAGWGTASSRSIAAATPSELRGMRLAQGSMGPKAEAAARFVERTGRTAHIGSLDEAFAVVEGRSGTTVRGAPGA